MTPGRRTTTTTGTRPRNTKRQPPDLTRRTLRTRTATLHALTRRVQVRARRIAAGLE